MQTRTTRCSPPWQGHSRRCGGISATLRCVHDLRIAYNESVTLIRARKSGDELSGYLTPYVATPEERIHLREQLGLLVEDLRRLPERTRRAIVMRELSGLSHEEIAVALGTSVSGAKQAIFEARTALTDFAAGRNMACEDVRDAITLHDRRVLRGRRVSAHLRDCPACARLAAELIGRQGRLRALRPPRPAGAATALRSRPGRPGSSVEAVVLDRGQRRADRRIREQLGPVIATMKGAFVAAAVVTGLGAAGAQLIKPDGGPASPRCGQDRMSACRRCGRRGWPLGPRPGSACPP